MAGWTQVKWTEAGQVTAALGWPPSEGDGEPPEAYFARLRADGRPHEAALFLGQALPRFEAVAWAAKAVRALSTTPAPADAEAIKATLLWLQDPTDHRRRAAFEASEFARDDSPERLCALAAFFSGGSLAPDDLQPVPAPKDAAGKFAACAVLAAAAVSGEPFDAALDRALEMGAALAGAAKEAGA